MSRPLLTHKFAPFRMSDALVLEVATGRDAQVDAIMRIIDENLAARDAAPQHLTIAAPRGTGKTFLLRLIGLRVKARCDAGEKIAFLHLPEEMPGILDPTALMREILVRFRGGKPEENNLKWRADAAAWDPSVAAIDAALAKRFGVGEGLLVLCLENIQDLVAAAFPKDLDQKRLRAWLDRSDSRIMLIAASSNGAYDDDYEKPLFRIAHTIDLGGWTADETAGYLDRVMRLRHGIGLSDTQQAKTRALAAVTGGSPRMAAALAEIITGDDVLTSAQVLDMLIDNLTPLYLDRLKDMGADARRCVDKLLREGENISQSELARRLGETQPVIAQTFRALRKKGIVLGERPEGAKEILYRIADRVFAHFYRVRALGHGRTVCVLEVIVEQLTLAFTDAQRVSEADRQLQPGLTPEVRLLLGRLSDFARNGRASDAFAAFNGLLTALAPAIMATNDPDDPRLGQLRQILRDRGVVLWPAGLLTDVATAAEEALPGRLDAESRMLREIARFDASGRDPAILARLDPDIAQMLRLTLPELADAAPKAAPGKKKRRRAKG
jgi:DNA-binding transcriptional ArsR family regulator